MQPTAKDVFFNYPPFPLLFPNHQRMPHHQRMPQEAIPTSQSKVPQLPKKHEDEMCQIPIPKPELFKKHEDKTCQIPTINKIRLLQNLIFGEAG